MKKQTTGNSKQCKCVSQVSHSSPGAANQALWKPTAEWQEISMAILLYPAAGIPTAGSITLGVYSKGKQCLRHQRFFAMLVSKKTPQKQWDLTEDLLLTPDVQVK